MKDYTNLASRIKTALEAYVKEQLSSYTLENLSRLGLFVPFGPDIEGWDTEFVHLVCSGCGLVDITSGNPLGISTLDQISSLVVYSYGACSNDLPQRILDLAVATNLMLYASGIFDDIQDQDKPSSLVSRFGLGKALNTGLFLILLGQNLLYDVLEELLEHPMSQTRGKSPNNLSFNPFLALHRFTSCLTFALRGQMLDLQEEKLPFDFRLSQPEYYKAKNGLKSAMLFSYLPELGSFVACQEFNSTVEVYHHFGFAFGSVLQMLADLGDFLVVTNHSSANSRDLAQRRPTLPLAYAYQSISPQLQRRLVELWQMQPIPLPEIAAILKDTPAVSQTIEQVAFYIAEAERLLRSLDPQLERIEHQLMLKMLHSFLQPFGTYFFQALKLPISPV